jgi:limonene 1,2-monooxygenase
MTNRHIRVGVFAPPHHANNENPTLAMQRDFQLVEWLEELGYSEFWLGEHHSGGMQIYGTPELFIAAAAERTTRIKLGAAVISLPYHNPLMVADRIVQLDHQTRGRAMFGFGPGALSSDAHMLNIPVNDSRDRMMQAVHTIVRLLDGDIVTEETEWYSLKDARVHLEPYTRPRPHLAVASLKTPTGALTAGRYNMGLLCAMASGVSSAWKTATEAAAQHGQVLDRDNLRVVGSFHLAETREKARENVKFGFEPYMEYLNVIRPPTPTDQPSTGDPIEKAIAGRGGVVGTPDDAVEALEKLWDQTGGFGCLLLSGTNWMDFEATKKSYELFMRYVWPKFCGQNRRRAASMDWMKQNAQIFSDIRDKAAAEAMKPSGT